MPVKTRGRRPTKRELARRRAAALSRLLVKIRNAATDATEALAPHAAVAPQLKPVTFSCSNPNCIVGIASGASTIAFTGTGGMLFPVGVSPIFWRVQGTGTFTITTAGGSLDAPIASEAPDAGTRDLTVP